MTEQPAEPRRRGPYAKSAARRDEIITAAFEVFAARGYHRGSFQDVADRLGVSQTSLFHYFPTKNDLLVAVLERRDRIVRPEREHAQTPTFIDGILHQAGLNTSSRGLIALYTVLCGEAVTHDHPARDYFASRFEDLRQDYGAEFQAIADAGGLKDGVTPARAATTLVALWDGAQLQWLLSPNEVDVPGLLLEYLNAILITPISDPP